jgi:hypothetical protein
MGVRRQWSPGAPMEPDMITAARARTASRRHGKGRAMQQDGDAASRPSTSLLSDVLANIATVQAAIDAINQEISVGHVLWLAEDHIREAISDGKTWCVVYCDTSQRDALDAASIMRAHGYTVTDHAAPVVRKGSVGDDVCGFLVQW